MSEYGYTPQQWSKIDDDEKVLMLTKKQLEIERNNRIRNNDEEG
ncbi:MAG: hypothetical protein ACQEQF_01740 [Bacillota bacterium]